ncbi:MAG TPA: response regulator transcription factor [Candidatus Limnocylindria bacterium]|nr:response regulator transcription factor [Candidatus Limnocylindria bacterium]
MNTQTLDVTSRITTAITIARPIAVLLVDDHQTVIEALRGVLQREPDMVVIGSAGSVREVADLPQRAPDVAIVDYTLPDGTGADACRHIKARWPHARIVMLSGTADDEAILSTLRAGADGYVAKAQRLAVLLSAIRATHAHEPIVDPTMLGRIARGLEGQAHLPPLLQPLTSRELTVLRALAGGQTTRGIAADLGIAEGTVRRHVEAIRRKFGVASRLEAVTKAIQYHVIQAPPA